MSVAWEKFVEEALNCALKVDAALAFDVLGEVSVSAVTVLSRVMLANALEEGKSGLVVGVCDYTQEAIAFSFGNALANSLSGRNQIRYSESDWKRGDVLSFGEFRFVFEELCQREFQGVQTPYLKYEYSQVSNFLPLDKIPGHICRCLPGTKPTSKRKGNPTMSGAISDYNAMSDVEKAFYDAISLVDKPVAYVTSKSSFANIPPTFLKNAKVKISDKTVPLESCLKTAYISSDGDLKESCRYPIEGRPAVITPCRDEEGIGDLYYILEYLESGNELEAVVVEAPESEAVDGMFGHLEDIIEMGVPVIVFCDERTMLETDAFDQLGFEKFSWSKEVLNEIGELAHQLGFPLSQRETRMASGTLRISPVEDAGAFPEIVKVFYSLADRRAAFSEKEKQALNSLNRLLSTALKQTEVVLEGVSAERIQRLDDAVSILTDESYGCSLTNEEVKKLKHAAFLLRGCFAPNVPLPKEDAAYSCMRHSLKCGRRACLVTSSDVSAREATDYWRDVFEDEGFLPNSIRAVTPRGFLRAGLTEDDEDVFISGWFSRELMDKLVSSGLSRVYSVLLYKGEDVPLETNWYISASNYWVWRSDKAKVCSKKTLKKTGVVTPYSLEPSNRNNAKMASGHHEPDSSISSIVEMIDDERAEAERAVGNEEAHLARAVYFSDGRHRWLRVPDSSSQLGGDKLVVLDGIYGGDISFDKKTAAALHRGDVVLKMDSDDNALDELCRAAFGSYEATLAVAKSWRKPIDDARCLMGDAAIVKKIKSAGSSKADQTIFSWIRGDRVIAPNKKRDIVAISEAFGNCFSEEEIQRIINAVRIVKGTRINSGKSITSSIVKAFISDIATFGVQDALLGFGKRHDLGTVELMCVDHVSAPQMVGISKFGYYID